MLLLFLSPNAGVPLDPSTGKPVEKAKERVDFLISKTQKARVKVIIPTPVYSEVLIHAGAARNDYLRIIDDSSAFQVADFCTRAAIEVADMTRQAIALGDKRGGSNDTWAKIKFDRQIVAIAKVHGASAIYSDDADIKSIGESLGIPVICLRDCDLPVEDKQLALELQPPDINSATPLPSIPEVSNENATDEAIIREVAPLKPADTTFPGGSESAGK